MSTRWYRGKRTNNKGWLHGSVIDLDEDCALIMPPYLHASTLSKVELINLFAEAVDPATVGQHVGILDKDETYIFEGDIVKVHDTLKRSDEPCHEFVGVVDFADGSFVIEDGCVTHDRWMDYEVEVLGNRWDNPELLPEEVS